MFAKVTDEERDEKRLDALQEQLRQALVVNADLMSDGVAVLATPGAAAKAERIHRLIQTEAWTEAALALVELVLPQWKPRRLVYEDGAWLCTLSRQWRLPDWLDDTVEAGHELLPLAILSASIGARRCGRALPLRATGSVPQCPIDSRQPVEAMCCDNFA